MRLRLDDALARLRAHLDRAHGGDRRAWSLALLPLVPRPRPIGALLGGVLLMSTSKLKLVTAAAAVAVLAAAGALWLRSAPRSSGTEGRTDRARAARRIAATDTAPPAPPATAPATPAIERRAVHVLHGLTGAPIDGAVVQVHRPHGDGLAAVTGADGIARLPAHACAGADVELEVRRVGFLLARRPLDPTAPGDVHVALAPGVPVVGRVVDAETGAPVADAQVRAMAAGFDVGRAVTDADGSFTISAVRPHVPFELTATSAGAGAVTGTFRRRGGADEPPVVLAVGAGAELHGRVVDLAGRPVADTGVAVFRLAASDLVPAAAAPAVRAWTTVRDPVARAVTDARGRYRVRGLAAPRRYGVRAGFAAESAVLPVRAADRYPVADLVLGGGVVVDGEIVTADGRPVAGAEVALHAHGAVVWSRPRDDGIHELAPLWTGAHELRVRAPGWRPVRRAVDVTGAPGARWRVVLAARGSELAVHVRDGRTGRAIPGVDVTFVQPDQFGRGRTGADGAVSLGGFVEAPGRLYVEPPPGSGYGLHELDGARAGPEQVEVRLPRLSSVRGRLAPVPLDRRVVVRGPSGDGAWAGAVAADGAFRVFLPLVPEHPHTLRFEVWGGAPVLRAGVVLRAGEATDLGVVAWTAGAVLEGIVVDETGAPVADASATLLRPPYPQRFASTDDGGAFRFASVDPDAPSVVTIHAEGFAPATIRGDGPLRVVLGRVATVRVRVLDGDGFPLARGSVVFERLDAPGRAATVCDDGWAGCTLPAGRWRVTSAPETGTATVVVEHGETVEAELRPR